MYGKKFETLKCEYKYNKNIIRKNIYAIYMCYVNFSQNKLFGLVSETSSKIA